ncbi:hypothetical protein pdam_00000176 [Pocillopora damicornis]|uniref:Retrotransposon gag domain-containing protein n=1 Tax=Pocillopora damicornis TaxID=46731 RepID=A0A3M6UXA3_POCDA|nr:hypothetical protein pdam_00000176 [Pocillopora damicornis]
MKLSDIKIKSKSEPVPIRQGALTQHFEPQRNTIFERYLLKNANQENENIDQYLNRLRKLASICTYDALCDELIPDRLVMGIKSHEVRRRILRDKALTLNTELQKQPAIN